MRDKREEETYYKREEEKREESYILRTSLAFETIRGLQKESVAWYESKVKDKSQHQRSRFIDRDPVS